MALRENRGTSRPHKFENLIKIKLNPDFPEWNKSTVTGYDVTHSRAKHSFIPIAFCSQTQKFGHKKEQIVFLFLWGILLSCWKMHFLPKIATPKISGETEHTRKWKLLKDLQIEFISQGRQNLKCPWMCQIYFRHTNLFNKDGANLEHALFKAKNLYGSYNDLASRRSTFERDWAQGYYRPLIRSILAF